MARWRGNYLIGHDYPNGTVPKEQADKVFDGAYHFEGFMDRSVLDDEPRIVGTSRPYESWIEDRPKRRVEDAGDYILIRDIKCTDAQGKVIEEYPELLFSKEPVKDPSGKYCADTFERCVHYAEQNGCFVPSSALVFNIMLTMFEEGVNKVGFHEYETVDELARQTLDRMDVQIDDPWLLFWANTAVKNQVVIHYPNRDDMGISYPINASRKRCLSSFDYTGRRGNYVSEADRDERFGEYAKNVLGIADLRRWIALEDYFFKGTNIVYHEIVDIDFRTTRIVITDNGLIEADTRSLPTAMGSLYLARIP